jgi:hypothetical protein
MDDNLFYDLSDLDIGDILREETDQLIKTLNVPELPEAQELEYTEELLEITVMDPSNLFKASEPSEP